MTKKSKRKYVEEVELNRKFGIKTRRHHNNTGLHQVVSGKTRKDVDSIAKRILKRKGDNHASTDTD